MLTAVILLGPRTFNLDGDLGRHITIGNYILQTASIPRRDIFSHTMTGQALTPHEWLAQVVFAIANRILGLSGVVLVTALAISTTFIIIFYEGQERSQAPIISLGITILAAAASSLHWLARPHVFTFLYLAIWMLVLERVRTRKKTPVWTFGLVMLLWANTHGAFIAGFVCWAAYLVGQVIECWEKGKWEVEQLKAWVIPEIVALAATFINPAGIHLWETSLGFVGNGYLVSHTYEYQPPDFHNPGTWPFLLMIGLTIVMLGIKKHRLPFSHSLLLAGWATMALYSARNIPLFAIVAAPILSEMAIGLLSGTKRWNAVEAKIRNIEGTLRSGVWIAVSILIAIVALSTPVMQAYNTFDASVFPVRAVDWLENHPQTGNVFNYFPWGGYLLYRQWPGTLVFIDGQTDFYGEALTREYEQVITLNDNWQVVLERYQVSWALLPKSAALTKALTNNADWKVLYQDDTATILRREVATMKQNKE
jgi:hypothetical protein